MSLWTCLVARSRIPSTDKLEHSGRKLRSSFSRSTTERSVVSSESDYSPSKYRDISPSSFAISENLENVDVLYPKTLGDLSSGIGGSLAEKSGESSKKLLRDHAGIQSVPVRGFVRRRDYLDAPTVIRAPKDLPSTTCLPRTTPKPPVESHLESHSALLRITPRHRKTALEQEASATWSMGQMSSARKVANGDTSPLKVAPPTASWKLRTVSELKSSAAAFWPTPDPWTTPTDVVSDTTQHDLWTSPDLRSFLSSSDDRPLLQQRPAHTSNSSGGISASWSFGAVKPPTPRLDSSVDLTDFRPIKINLDKFDTERPSILYKDYIPSSPTKTTCFAELRRQNRENQAGMIDADALADLPSLGSIGHASGSCRSCVFFHKSRGCHQGYNCDHCHACDSKEMWSARRPAKRRRDRALLKLSQSDELLVTDDLPGILPEDADFL